MTRKVNFKGTSLSLVGRALKKGDKAPGFRAVSIDLKDVTLSDFEGKVKVITSFLSLDTPVCDLQVKEFNKQAAGFSSGIVVLGISKDLPFAQKRFCQFNDIKNVAVISDYKFSSFGINYGLLVKELNLLARAIVILDRDNYIRYIQIAEELTLKPDYEDALKNLEEVLRSPSLPVKEGVTYNKCKPCEGGVTALSQERISVLMADLHNWQLVEGKRLLRELKFKDFSDAKYFLDLISVIFEEQGHHPTVTLSYNKLKLSLTTHSAGGLTENDFIMANIIDELLLE